MLQSLQVHNFALIEDAQVEFTPGFNIFTGETGAGKSILIDAFGIVLGGRASTSFIRSGTEEFRIQAVFDTEGDPRVSSLLREQDIEEEDSLYLKRTLTAAGKSRSSINGMPVPLAVLKRVSRLLVDIHGQHENQSLLHPKMPLRLTDTFGGDEGQAARQQYDDAYDRYQEARQSLAELEEKGGQRERLMDRLQWEIQEIEEAAITPGEEERLRDEVKVLEHVDKIRSALSEAYELLDRENGALDLLADSRGAIETAQRFDSSLQDIYEGLDSAWIAADDAKSRLRDYMESQDFDEARLGEVQDRLDLLYRLQKKYGAGEAAVLAYGQKAKEQYAELQDLDQRVAQARERCRRETDALKVAAAALTKVRQRTAKKLCEAVTVHMRDLAMPEGKFTIQFSEKPDFGEDGRDQMEFLFSANRGEPLKPLVQVASGGELSRLALALKTVLIHTSGVRTMVFDEIDTGVGGVTAQKMAEKLALISRENQVLCITHLPQIAAFADHQIRIRKEAEGDRTVTRLTVLDREERVREIMRMATGSHVSRSAEANARELLEEADRFKQEADSARQTKRPRGRKG